MMVADEYCRCGTGLLGGLAVSTFSKTLAFLLGLAIFGVQVRKFTPAGHSEQWKREMTDEYQRKWAASHGYNIVPTSRIQRYVRGIDLRSTIEDNVAFKLSFGATFMLAAVAEL